MIDYEAMILARQEATEIWEDDPEAAEDLYPDIDFDDIEIPEFDVP